MKSRIEKWIVMAVLGCVWHGAAFAFIGPGLPPTRSSVAHWIANLMTGMGILTIVILLSLRKEEQKLQFRFIGIVGGTFLVALLAYAFFDFTQQDLPVSALIEPGPPPPR